MNNFKKLFALSLSTFTLTGNVFANTETLNSNEIEREIATQIEIAVSQIHAPVIEDIAKTQLDEMALKQNVEQFLSLARFNEETAVVNTQINAE